MHMCTGCDAPRSVKCEDLHFLYQSYTGLISVFIGQSTGVVYRIWCFKISGPRTVLLGDAAHAVTPVGGQGANAALEDCIFLDGILDSTGVSQASRQHRCVPTFY